MKCKSCENICEDGRKRCIGCLQKEKENAAKRRNKRRELGLCVSCNNPVVHGYTRCEIHLLYERNKNKKYKEMKKCLNCGKDTEKGNRCKDCLQNITQKSNVQRRKRVEFGLCPRCGNKKESLAKCCEICFLKKCSETCFGINGRWVELQKLYEEQKKCPYSGEELFLGINCQLDHKIPRSKGGSNELSNLQWVYSPINTMKWDLDEIEFLQLVKRVALHSALQHKRDVV